MGSESTKLLGTMPNWPTSWRELHKRLREQGCEIRCGKHYRVISRDGRTYTLPRTASDRRALRNCVLGLRRIGIDVSR